LRPRRRYQQEKRGQQPSYEGYAMTTHSPATLHL
jgi:hypothetical protein